MEEIKLSQQSRRLPKIPVTDESLYSEDEYDDDWQNRLPTSSRRYQANADVQSESGRRQADAAHRLKRPLPPRKDIPPRRSATQTDLPIIQASRPRAPRMDDDEDRHTSGLLGTGRRLPLHWLVFAGGAMFVMIVGWIAFTALSNWWQVTQDDWHYGRPRTYQVDMAVGHNDSAANPTHFIAENLNRHILIIEIPGGDASKSKIYSGPILIGPDQDLTPVTLTFKDVNNDGKLDMVVNVQGSHFVYLNQNGQFVAAPGLNGS